MFQINANDKKFFKYNCKHLKRDFIDLSYLIVSECLVSHPLILKLINSSHFCDNYSMKKGRMEQKTQPAIYCLPLLRYHGNG